MRLRSIYIKGFKSFYKETLINFNEKVTGIVGPNGSGKSNIVDAIRWVLGEQKTTELRLDSMSDVLFNGTSKRKKSSMAQVTLTFDNTKNLLPTEYNTVAISRILYRSGESEYRINDVACRLKDIRSLFIDTGIGSDSYAIIALNMVEDILADSNGSRRMMVEQASGISKFKKRKKETLAKLKLTKVDLDRIEDLLFEIESNLKDLEKQARKAERYIKIRDQYKDFNIKLQLLKYDKVVDSYKDVSENIKNELTKYRTLEVDIVKKEAILEKFKKEIVESEKSLSEFQKKINEHLDTLRKNENEKQLLKQKYGFNKNKLADLAKAESEINNKLNILISSIGKIKTRIEEEKHKLKDFQNIFDGTNKIHLEIKAKYEEVKSFADISNIKRKKLEDQKFQLLKSQAVSLNNIENIVSNNNRRIVKVKLIEEELEVLDTDYRSTEEHKIRLLNDIEALEHKKEERAILQRKADEELELLRQKKSELGRKLDAKRNEYRLVKSMVDNLEGFPESIKFLNKKWNSDIPLLTDIISTDDEYKIAIETYLEPYLNHFVVDNNFQAREAIGLLRKTQKGKANFFVLERVKDVKKVKGVSDNYISAMDIVEYDIKYKKLVEILLQNVYVSIVEMDEVYSGSDDDDVVIIDKSGSFVSGGHMISGGSLGLFEGKKIGRKKNLEKLHSTVSKFEKEFNEISTFFEKKTEQLKLLRMEVNERGVNKIKKDFDKVSDSLLRIKFQIENKSNTLLNLKSEIESGKEKIAKIKETEEANKVKIGQIEKKLKELLDNYNNKGGDIDILMENLSQASAKMNNAKIELIRHQNLISTIEQDLNYKISDKSILEKQLDSNKQLSKNLDSEQINIERRLDELEQTLVKLYELKSTNEEDLSEIEKEFFEKRNKVSSLESEISKLKHQLTKSQYLINQLKEKKLDLDFKKKAINERLRIEFNIQLKDILNYDRTDIEEYILEDKVGRLRNRLDNYGEVNTLAVEAYNEMKERYENIKKQRQDILDAEKSLNKTITEIEKTATTRFLAAFEEIREHFKVVFTTLFKEGDTCDLFLEEKDRPLDSKIKIVAKPKGKRPKTLSQLSGGEKTLTAIALLFSLYLYKPAPFCIFDEVDAPLDDANISKFNNIIREFSKNSQFIVVTHNKATMAAVDVLYGVFMQELGVSEVAQVDFRNYENLHTVAG